MSEKLVVLKTADEIQKRVKEIGEALTKKFKGREPVCISVLNGSFMFYSDLIRAMDLDLTCEFLGVSSYKSQKVSSGEVELTLDLSSPLSDKDVILIEDMVDTGLTMNYLIGLFKGRRPRSLTTVSLFLKPKALKEKCRLDFVGFEVHDDFIVGYGLDHEGLYRNLPFTAIIEKIN